MVYKISKKVEYPYQMDMLKIQYQSNTGNYLINNPFNVGYIQIVRSNNT